MKTREDVIRACLSLPSVYEDYPFNDGNWTVMRHKESKKSFALIFLKNGQLWVNVKAEPVACDFWKQQYEAVVPAYHMNKKHWISIILDGSMTNEDILLLITNSYNITLTKSTHL